MQKRRSALTTILIALIPYSHENLKLAYSPNRFFNDLERSSGYKRHTLDQAVRRGKQAGLIANTNNSLRLTTLGRRSAFPYLAIMLGGNAKLMIIFDIPENQAGARKKLRTLLKKWSFVQTQKSVWITEYDHRRSVKEAVAELNLEGFVELYECVPLPFDKA